MSVAEILQELRRTNVTETIHQKPYHAISPTRAELSQAGRSVLITGGGTGVGFSIAQAFIRASAATIIIVGRRAEVLNSARLRLEEEAKAVGARTKIITKPCDVISTTEVDKLWEDLRKQDISVNVYIANAAKFTEVQPLLELGTDEVWNQVETNVKSPLHFAEKFWKQPGDNQKVRLLIISQQRNRSCNEADCVIRSSS
jgi:NAD(P)-dependent dehydrogenase (short-subunit alcohol dehydrogenase family)